MANMLCKTKGNADPKGKPRVYFTCHPEDFDKYFERVCADVFRSHDCAVFYTEDMQAQIPDRDKKTDLESNNLFVVPVTLKLLIHPNRAMDADISFALEKHIPVLPIMMESGLDAVYSRPDKFGELQYLAPFSADKTEVSYEDKLKRYLESVLISDEMAKKIRGAFSAYIFLSYRKKDRRHANELMRLIHRYPECRDIAIWYDEFLTPGESFRENIRKILEKSKLFALLVTPSLLEEPDGRPNFVMGEEYPAARASGVEILPAEMEATDKDMLSQKFLGIPQCVDPRDDAGFKTRLLDAISKIARTENADEPMHTFLMGLAYLEGIDVEVDRQRGLDLIVSAAESDLPAAMEKLCNLYREGVGVRIDYREAAAWAQRLAHHHLQHYGAMDRETLVTLNNLAVIYRQLGDYAKALELGEEVYALSCQSLGMPHPDTLSFLDNLASAYYCRGDYTKALELRQMAYLLNCRVLGEEHQKTFSSLSSLAIVYSKLGEYSKALELNEKAYSLRCKILGEEHPDTLLSLNNLASAYTDLGDNKKAMELKKKAYAIRCRILGEEHPSTLVSLNNLAVTYCDLGDPQKAMELGEKVYLLRCKVLGEEHPDTLTSLDNMAHFCCYLGAFKRAVELTEKVYTLRCSVLGEEHPETIRALSNVAGTYGNMGDYQKTVELGEKVYALRRKILGEIHPDTRTTLNNLAVICKKLGNYTKALELGKQDYEICCRLLGETHPDTLTALNNLATYYYYLGDDQKAVMLSKKVYALRCTVLGEEHPETITSKQNLEFLYIKNKLCQHCGGSFVGILKKKCRKCGKLKDY